ncbi:MAG: hypothetical protein ABI091_25825 [Ferruginibacter sp.]
MPTISCAGYNINHAPVEIKEKLQSKHKEAQKRKNERLRISSKLRELPENAEMVDKIKGLKEWFAYHTDNSERKCENCGADLSNYNDKDWRSSQDHIIEKSSINGCPSVSSCLENHCVLGLWCGCHGQKHTSNLNMSKMEIFPILKHRFNTFKNLINESEKRKIPECFI